MNDDRYENGYLDCWCVPAPETEEVEGCAEHVCTSCPTKEQDLCPGLAAVV